MKVERAMYVVCSSGAAKRWWRWRSTRSQQQRRRMPAQIPTKLFPFANPPLHRLETAGNLPRRLPPDLFAVSVVRSKAPNGSKQRHTDPTNEDVARGPREGGLHRGRPTALVPPTAALYVAFKPINHLCHAASVHIGTLRVVRCQWGLKIHSLSCLLPTWSSWTTE